MPYQGSMANVRSFNSAYFSVTEALICFIFIFLIIINVITILKTNMLINERAFLLTSSKQFAF